MGERLRVLITDHPWPDCRLEQELLEPAGAEVVDAPQSDEATLSGLAADCDAIATCWAKVTPEVIRSVPNCRIVSRLGIGLDNIAVDTATELGIPVTNCPDYCVSEVSDHALALLMACARQIGFFHHRTKQGEYDLRAAPPMQRLAGRQLGLVGLGHTAQALAPKARGIGLRVAATTPSGNDYGTGCRMLPFDELLETSDFISLHAPLTPQTRRMFDAAAFERMKPTAFLVNTARGGLIDHAALAAALDHKKIAGAALDVFDPEPPRLSEPLFRNEQVIATPHVAFLSNESLDRLRRQAMEQVVTALRGDRPEHVVNPAVYRDAAT